MKKSTALPAGRKPLPEAIPLSVQLDEAIRRAELAKIETSLAKASFKKAKKVFKLARKAAKVARKEAETLQEAFQKAIDKAAKKNGSKIKKAKTVNEVLFKSPGKSKLRSPTKAAL